MIAYVFFRIAVGVISLIPFWIIYRISDLLAFVLRSIFKYRRKVILGNLERSFPEKSTQEIQSITRKFYLNLADIMLEGLKGMSCSQEELIKRYHFINPNLVQNIFKKGDSVVGIVAHYCNWEWGAFATAPQIGSQVVGVSKSIKNPYIDQFTKNSRSRLGAHIIHMSETARAIIQHRSTPTLFVLIADQSPANARNAHWLTFLNQETACMTGPDKIARKTNYPVIYFDVQRVKRGFYEITAHLLMEQTEDSLPGEITKLYMAKLEEIIRKKPENWLWSHRRWKKKRIG